MTQLIHDHKEAVAWISAISLLLFVGSLVVVPWLVVRIPADHFTEAKRPVPNFARNHPVLRWVFRALKNLAGAVLLLAGFAMLLLPGQGLLTIALGIALLDFPGKHRLERRIMRMPAVLRTSNWLRRKAGVAPLNIPAEKPRRRENPEASHS